MFKTELKIALRKNDGKSISKQDWKLLSDFIYKSALVDSLIVVPTGFVTDFASVPRLPIIFLLVGDTAIEASCVHDFLYRSGAFDRSMCDRIFREAAIESGVPAWRVFLLYNGVRLFGSGFYLKTQGAQNG